MPENDEFWDFYWETRLLPMENLGKMAGRLWRGNWLVGCQVRADMVLSMRNQYSPTALLFGLPLLLLPVMVGIFALFARWLGAEAGYLLGFGLYWLVWCLLIPRALLGKEEFSTILHDRAPLFSRANWIAGLLWLVVTLIAGFMYAGEFIRAPLVVILLAIPLATLNGFCEEILWRGLYLRRFPRNPWLGILYPALGFALWHVAPQVVFPAENVTGFVISTFFLALPYGFIAYKTGSARWTAISHSLNGILALSGYLAPSALALLS